jgi:hypothetical protein
MTLNALPIESGWLQFQIQKLLGASEEEFEFNRLYISLKEKDTSVVITIEGVSGKRQQIQSTVKAFLNEKYPQVVNIEFVFSK